MACITQQPMPCRQSTVCTPSTARWRPFSHARRRVGTPLTQHEQVPAVTQQRSHHQGRQRLVCKAADDRQGSSASKAGAGLANKFNPIYFAITGAFAALLVFRNPYIYAVLTILTVLPQNSNVTSLNNLVLLFYESGLFMNFAEAVYCVRLVTWLSMGFMVLSFSIFH